MEVKFHDGFIKDISKIKDRTIQQRIKRAILKIETADSFDKITNLKALKGEKNAYRLRTGDYRIGIYVNDGIFELARVAHRKDIYNLFP